MSSARTKSRNSAVTYILSQVCQGKKRPKKSSGEEMGAVLLQTNNTSFMEQKILRVIFCVKRALKRKKENKLQSISMCTNFTLQHSVLQE